MRDYQLHARGRRELVNHVLIFDVARGGILEPEGGRAVGAGLHHAGGKTEFDLIEGVAKMNSHKGVHAVRFAGIEQRIGGARAACDRDNGPYTHQGANCRDLNPVPLQVSFARMRIRGPRRERACLRYVSRAPTPAGRCADRRSQWCSSKNRHPLGARKVALENRLEAAKRSVDHAHRLPAVEGHFADLDHIVECARPGARISLMMSSGTTIGSGPAETNPVTPARYLTSKYLSWRSSRAKR